MRVRKLHRLEVPAGLTFKALKHSCLQELNNNSIKIMICPTEQPNIFKRGDYLQKDLMIESLEETQRPFVNFLMLQMRKLRPLLQMAWLSSQPRLQTISDSGPHFTILHCCSHSYTEFSTDSGRVVFGTITNTTINIISWSITGWHLWRW